MTDLIDRVKAAADATCTVCGRHRSDHRQRGHAFRTSHTIKLDAIALETARALIEVTEERDRLRGVIADLFDEAQQVHRDGGRTLAKMVTDAYED